MTAFSQGLAEAGYVVSRNVNLQYRSAENDIGGGRMLVSPTGGGDRAMYDSAGRQSGDTEWHVAVEGHGPHVNMQVLRNRIR